jgi:hypothetical protein
MRIWLSVLNFFTFYFFASGYSLGHTDVLTYIYAYKVTFIDILHVIKGLKVLKLAQNFG